MKVPLEGAAGGGRKGKAQTSNHHPQPASAVTEEAAGVLWGVDGCAEVKEECEEGNAGGFLCEDVSTQQNSLGQLGQQTSLEGAPVSTRGDVIWMGGGMRTGKDSNDGVLNDSNAEALCEDAGALQSSLGQHSCLGGALGSERAAVGGMGVGSLHSAFESGDSEDQEEEEKGDEVEEDGEDHLEVALPSAFSPRL